ncbi:MAG: 50S ribosomal protein L15e [Candidatus Pacearchaeota archaeon]
MKSLYAYVAETLRAKRETKEWSQLLARWRKSRAITRVAKPFNIARARILGYKAKKGFVVVRVRVRRGGHKRPRPRKGRKTKKLTIRKTLKMNYQWIAEQRAARKFPNLEVLNSYWLAKDGQYYWFEVILIDPNAPEIKADKNLSWICSNKHRGRVFRGLTSAAKKARGLR